MPQELKVRVEEWLAAMGCEPVERDDPTTRWHLAFEYPMGSGHRMLVAGIRGPAEALVVASVVSISPQHLEAFEELNIDERRSFVFGLRHSLNSLETEFQLNGMESPLTCPSSFQVSARRFPDGLSLDSFARSVGAVYKTELAGIWHIQEWLGGPAGPLQSFPLDLEDLPQA